MYYTILCLVIETHGTNEYSDTKSADYMEDEAKTQH